VVVDGAASVPVAGVVDGDDEVLLVMSGVRLLLVRTLDGFRTAFLRASSARATSASGRVDEDVPEVCAVAIDANVATIIADTVMTDFMFFLSALAPAFAMVRSYDSHFFASRNGLAQFLPRLHTDTRQARPDAFATTRTSQFGLNHTPRAATTEGFGMHPDDAVPG
jgi:hypothetical protein